MQSGCSLRRRAISNARSAESIDEPDGTDGGVSYVDDETSAGVMRDRLMDDVGTRLYKSGVMDRTGVENSSFAGG